MVQGAYYPGRRFGCWKIVERHDKNKWVFECSCGHKFIRVARLVFNRQFLPENCEECK